MAFVRIDQEFYDHPKWATAPGDSIALWVAAMAWCNRNESWDGYIPANKLAGLVNVRNVKRTVADLCDRVAFSVHGEGYLIHEYPEYQQNEKVRKLRDTRSEAGKKGAESRWRSHGKPMANAIANAWQTHGNENAPVSGLPVLLKTPPTTTTSHRDLPSAVAVVKAIVDVEFAGCQRRGIVTHPAPYRAGIQTRVERDTGPALDAALADNPSLTPSELGERVLNGHPQRLDILDALEANP
jgi:hypothetical protein